MERKAERQESLMQRLGGGLARGVEWAWGTEENPSWLQAAVELLSTPSYVGTSALDYARQDKSAFQGALEGAQLGVSPLLKKLGMRPKPAKAKKQMWSDVGAEEVSKLFPTVPEYSSGVGLATLANFIPRAVGGLAGLGVDILTDPLSWVSAGGEGLVKMATRALAKEGLAALSLGTKKGVSSAAKILTEDRLKMLKGFKKIEDVDIPAKRAELTKQFESAIEKAYKTEGPFNLRTRTVFGEPNLEYGAAEIAGKGYKRLPFTPTYEQAGKSFPSRLGRALGVPRGVTAVKQVLAPYLQGLDTALHYQIPLPTQGPLGAVTKLFFKPVEREVPWLREQAPSEIEAAGMPSSRQATRQAPKPPSPPAGGTAVPTPPAGPTAPPAAGRTTEDLFNQAMDEIDVLKRAPAAAEAPKVQMPDVEIGKPAAIDPEVLNAVETNPVVARIVEEASSPEDIRAVISVEGKQLGPEVSETLEAIAKTREGLREAKLHLEQIQAEQAKAAAAPPKVMQETPAAPAAKKMTLAVSPAERKALDAQKKVVKFNIKGAGIPEAERAKLRAELKKTFSFEGVQAIADRVSAMPTKILSPKKLRTTLPGPDTKPPTSPHLRELIIRRLKSQINEDYLRPSMRQGPNEPTRDLDDFLDFDKGNRTFKRILIDFGDVEFDSQIWNRMDENPGRALRDINFGNDRHPLYYRGNEELGDRGLAQALKEEKELTEEDFKRWKESEITLSSKIGEVGEEGQKVLDVDLKLDKTTVPKFAPKGVGIEDLMEQKRQGDEWAAANRRAQQLDLSESKPLKEPPSPAPPAKGMEPLKENTELVAKRHARRVIKETEEKIESQEGFIARTREKMKTSSEFEREFEEKAVRRTTQEIKDLRNGDEYLKAKSLIEGRVLKETDAEIEARRLKDAQEFEIQDLPFSVGKGKGAESIPKAMREMRGEIPLAQAVQQGKLSADHLKPIEALMDASPAFRRNVELLYTEKSYKAPRVAFEAHGYSASDPDKILKGWAELNDAGKSFLTISKHADPDTAAHEAGHFAQKYLLRGGEMQTVQKLHGVSGSKQSAKEWFSDQFAKWLHEKPFHQGLTGFFRNIAGTFIRAFKALGGDSAAKLEQIFERAIKREKMVPLAFEPKSLKMSIGPTKQTVSFTDLAGNQQTVEATVRRVNVGQSIRKVMGEDTSLKTWGLKKAGGGGLEEGRFIEVVLPPMSEKVTFYERTGLTKMIDTLISPISRIRNIDPILTERGRQFDAKMLVHKQEIDQAATLFAKQFSDPKDLNQFHRYVEDPAFAKTLDPKKAQEFADAKVIWDNWFDAKTGILPKMLEESGLQKNFWEEYISHIRVTRPEMDWDEIATKTSSALSSWEKFKLHRVNTTLDELIKKTGRGTYEDNAAVILGIRLYSGYRVLEKKAYLNQLLNKRSQDLGLVFKGAESRPGYIAITGHEPNSEMFPQLKGWSIREDVYLHLNHQFEEWRTNLVYWNLLAKIQRFWKPIATIYNPKFHARNFEGNLWNNFLKGVVNPNRYLQAAAIQSEAINKRLGGIKIKLGGGYEVGADELRKLFLEEGLLNRGAFSADMGEIISKTLQREIKGAGSLKGKLIDMPRKVGQAIEDNARIALAIDRLEKGDDVVGMMAAVREALFDYDEITPREKGIRRNVLPFYVWYRKNIPLQIRYFFKQPGKFSAAVKTASAIEGEKGRKEREEIQPDWMKKSHGFNLTPLLGKTKTGEQRLAGAALPYEDPFRFVENPGRELAGQLNPGIRLPVEMFFREDLGTGQKWDKPGLEGTELSGRRVENLIGSLPKPLWPVFGIRQFDDPETGVKVTEMKPLFYNFWRTMFRPGRELAAMADTEKDALTRVLSQVLTMIEVDPEKAKFFKAWRRTKRNEAILKEAQRDVPYSRRRYR